MSGDVPPLSLHVFMVCTRTILVFVYFVILILLFRQISPITSSHQALLKSLLLLPLTSLSFDWSTTTHLHLRPPPIRSSHFLLSS